MAVSTSTEMLSAHEAHQDLIDISTKYGTGRNITKAEFRRLDEGGHLDGWLAAYSYNFEDLDVNGSGRISEVHDASMLVRASRGYSDAEADRSAEVSGGEGSRRVSGDSGDSSDRSTRRISGDVVVLQFGWSDTAEADTKADLRAAGISSSDYKYSYSNKNIAAGADKGVGIAVVTKEQAEKFERIYNGSKTFAYTHEAISGVNDIDDLDVDFKVGVSNGNIRFGGGTYGALMTDDPARRTSGSNVQGRDTGSDSFWSVSGGDRGSAQMYTERNSPNGRQYVRMDARKA